EIDHPHAARGSGRCRDHGVRPLRPPGTDLCFVRRRVLEAAAGERFLVERIGRKHRNATTRIVERGLELIGRRGGPWLSAHVILPPSLRKRECRYWCCFSVGSRPKTVRAAMSSMNS